MVDLKMKDLRMMARNKNHKRTVLRRFTTMLSKLLACTSFNISNHHTVASIYVTSIYICVLCIYIYI